MILCCQDLYIIYLITQLKTNSEFCRNTASTILLTNAKLKIDIAYGCSRVKVIIVLSCC